FGIDTRARYFAAFDSVSQLEHIMDAAKQLDTKLDLIVGEGSNILLTQNIGGLVLKNDTGGIHEVNADEQHIYLKAGGGVNWHSFVLYCVEHNYAGVENLALIPGSVGASPMQNIGAYGVELKDIFYELEAYHIQDKQTRVFTLEECGFGYRDSVFKNKYKGQFIITSVTYRLNKIAVLNTSYGAIEIELEKMGVTSPGIDAVARAVSTIRRSKLPDWKVLGNAGSFFKNPQISLDDFRALQQTNPGVIGFPLPGERIKLAAGWLIEQCGWKGYRNGDAGCFLNQALVLVNYGAASGTDIYNLSSEIIESVKQAFGVTLEREVNII
ncbi:MAG: UDP-N-acetylmuramate dehydrogenase, partial [Chitinophagaceae bacterium]